jgi:acyl carrier protein
MVENKTVEKRVVEAVARVFHKDVNQLSRDTRFVNDLLAKSINIIELIAVLEYEFDIEIPAGGARKNQMIGETVDFIEELLRQQKG